MRIAVIGAGATGLSAARLLGEDPRHVTAVFETRERCGAPDAVVRLGVILRPRAQVERLAVSGTGVDLWINGVAERFDLAVVTTSAAQTSALLVRSGLRRRVGSGTLGRRVYFTGTGDAHTAARAALVQMAADHPGVRRWALTGTPRESPLGQALRALGARLAGHVELLDLSGVRWPLDVPAVYLASHRRALDAAVQRQLGVRHLRTSGGTAADLEAGLSLGFVGADIGAAVAALATNAPMVPIAAAGSRVAIGEPFYPETSSTNELLGDMCLVLRHLERLAVDGGPAGPPSIAARPGRPRITRP